MGFLPKLCVAFVTTFIGIHVASTLLLRDQEIGWGLRFIEYKNKLADKVNGNKILFTGGSGVLYGIRGDIIEEETGLPGINFGVNGGFGQPYTLAHAKKYLNPGDVFVFTPEYEGYWSKPNEIFKNDFHSMRLHSPERLIEIPLDLLTEYVLSTNVLDSLWATLVYYLRVVVVGDYGQPVDLDNTGSYRGCKQVYNGEIPPLFPEIPEREKMNLITTLHDLKKWTAERGITFVFSFPAMAKHDVFDSEAWLTRSRKVRDVLVAEGISTLGEPAEFIYDRKMFCDSRYHLNDYGAPTYSRTFSKLLVPILKEAGKLPSTKTSLVPSGTETKVQ